MTRITVDYSDTAMAQGTFLFLGDYFITEYNWQKRMPLFKVLCYGIEKSTVDVLLQKLPRIEKEVAAPDIILIMTGINNVIAEDYTFVDQIRRAIIRLTNHYSSAEIIVNSLPAIKIPFLVEDAIFHLNNSIREMASQTGCCYLDNFTMPPLTESGFLKEDGLRLNDRAYELWARSILEYVAFLYEDG